MRRPVMVTVLVLGVVVAGLLAAGCPKKQPVAPAKMPGMMPGKMMGKAGPAGLTYVCSTHADQKSDVPAKCPTCDAYMVADTDQEVEYFCPMHSDVAQDEPGECPKCAGMLLQAKPKGAMKAAPGASSEAATEEPGRAGDTGAEPNAETPEGPGSEASEEEPPKTI